MTGYIKKPHTSTFIGQTGCGKIHLVLELIEKEYNKNFDYIVVICPTLWENNKTYHAKEWIKNDHKVWLVDPKDNLYQWIKKLSELLRFLKVLFIISDISGRHQSHYLWLLTLSYSAISKKLRRQAKVVFVLYPKERADLKAIHYENDVLTDDELVVVRVLLRKSKHICLYIQNEDLRGFGLLNHVWGDYFWVSQMDSLNAVIIS